MVVFYVIFPFIIAPLAFLPLFIPIRRWLLLLASVVHFVAVVVNLVVGCEPVSARWIALDSLGLLFLAVTSLLFLASSVYLFFCWHTFAPVQEESRTIPRRLVMDRGGVLLSCLLAFLATMSLVSMSRHFGLLWIALEATTLATAPLVAFNRTANSLEATWKYLLVCSVGIALGLLGTFLLAIASPADVSDLLTVDALVTSADLLHPAWLRAAFLVFLVGYGTKMGLAPMHTWLPDAHSQAPAPVSALLSGALLNCAFLGILRVLAVCVAAEQDSVPRLFLLGFGLLSMGMAVLFVLRQFNFKRLLAYSTVEHMGILAVGVGIGGHATAGSFLHVVNHSVVKAMLFLVAGTLLMMFGTKHSHRIRGLLNQSPALGFLWLMGLLALSGSPPFGLFFSEFIIIRQAFSDGRFIVAAAVLVMLCLVFVGMGGVMFPVLGEKRSTEISVVKVHSGLLLPPIVLLLISLGLGVYVPQWLVELISHAAGTEGLGL